MNVLRLSRPHLTAEAVGRVADVVASGWLTQGSENAAFEAELGHYLSVPHVVTVSSGTAALHIALLALDIGPGDAVLVPDFTFVATANAVAMTGARPFLIDVDPATFTISADLCKRAISDWRGPERLRAIMPVHEFGCPADMTPLAKLADSAGLTLIEDAACALGARSGDRRLGTLGRIGCFSFHPRKTLTTGEGGALVTSEITLAERARRLRNHGIVRRGDAAEFVEVAPNYRLTNFQAAMGRAQLPKLDGWIETRRKLRYAYEHHLAGLSRSYGICLPAPCEGHSWQTYMVVLPPGIDRKQVVEHLRECGIEAGPGAQSVSAQPTFAATEVLRTPDHVARRLASNGLALPFCELYTEADVARVARALEAALASFD